MVHRRTSKPFKAKAKTILRLVDLEQSKTVVLHSLGAASSQVSYGQCHRRVHRLVPWNRLPLYSLHCPTLGLFNYVTGSRLNGHHPTPQNLYSLGMSRQ